MRAAAFFDIDGTLLRGESQFSFLLWCLRRGVAPRLRALPVLAQYGSYLAGLSRDAVTLRQSGFRLLRGIPIRRIEDSAVEFFRADLAGRFRRNAGSLLEAHRANGDLVVVITSACEPLANLVGAHLQADAVLSTRLIVADGVFTGNRELPEPYGEGKRILVERFCTARGFVLAECHAYADHHSDIPLLELVGHPTAVNPTKRLRQACAQRGWNVVDLERELPKSICEVSMNRQKQTGR